MYDRPDLLSLQLRALAVIHRKGPLEPQDPNRGGGRGGLTTAQREAIRMRVEESCEHSSDSEEGKSNSTA